MTIRFKKGYLAVGHRLKDWTIVWFKPHGDLQEDGSYATLTLYKCLKDSSKSLFREPMTDEVCWFPWYDWKTMPTATSSAKSKQRIQLEFISDAWRYCNEKERNASDILERELGNLGDSRWVAWLTEAKKWKKGKHKRTVEHNPEADPNIMDDASSDDSAYESDSELRAAARKAARSMPPPPRPARNSNSGKRRQGDNRGKPTEFGRRTKRAKTSPLFMSDNGGSPSFSLRRSESFGSPRVNGEDPYAASDGDDDMENTVSHSKPSRLGPSPDAGGIRSSSCGTRGSPIEVDPFQGDDGLGSHPRSLGRASPARHTSRPRSPGSAAAAPPITPPTTNGRFPDHARSTPKDTALRRDMRGSSVENPFALHEDDDDDDEARPPPMTPEEGAQRLLTYYAAEYQPLNMTDDEALREAERQSMAPEDRSRHSPGAADLPDGVRPSTEDADES
ncbi:hypothetical protein Tdes44962_MAKER00845 [Teratosphaeria destructans]|uniref:Uncharacterized protein n=1 Tax=Teratosphaeria destructans TaxID=418781 RepID=A0A9W7SKQ8_9PEZI|nr:hypothetical protein Tdes44962_MAKER00845 [Teratosphaeria destructans]